MLLAAVVHPVITVDWNRPLTSGFIGRRDGGTGVNSPTTLQGVRYGPSDGVRWADPITRSGVFTVEDFLRLPVTMRGRPKVVAGEEFLHRRIRWVHVTELTELKGLLEGGELILTTGIALPSSPIEMERFVDGLAAEGVSCLVLELGRRFHEPPVALVRACDRNDLPFIVLTREVAFVKITEAVHSLIIAGQNEFLRVTTAVHQRFTELSLADASVDEIVSTIATLAEGSVIFENLMHQVIAHEPWGTTSEELLARWERRGRLIGRSFGTITDETEEMAITPVEVRGQQWGRLALLTNGAPTPVQIMVLERGAAALTLNLLLEESRDALVLNAQRAALIDIVHGRYTSPEAMHARTASLGHPTANRHFLPVVVWPRRPHGLKLVRQALVAAKVDALTGELGADRIGVLLLLPSTHFRPGLEAFADRLHQLTGVSPDARLIVAAGSVVSDLADVARSFAEATDVAQAARVARLVKPFYLTRDVQLRGLLFTLGDDPRVHAFVDRMIGPLILQDSRDSGDWVKTLAAYIRHGGNKSLAAHDLGISRQTLYERLGRIQRLLGIDLADPETRTSLHAAIMVIESRDPAVISADRAWPRSIHTPGARLRVVE